MLPDPEAVLVELAAKMAAGIAADAKLVGIYSGGAWLAERLAAMLPGDHKAGFIDVSFYRDDYSRKGLPSSVKRTSLPFEIDGADLVLVDDVLFTGRSVRAALNELFDFGRPASVDLAVLVDRGGRELPIEAAYVGSRVAVASDRMLVLERSADGRLALSLEPAEHPPRDGGAGGGEMPR